MAAVVRGCFLRCLWPRCEDLGTLPRPHLTGQATAGGSAVSRDPAPAQWQWGWQASLPRPALLPEMMSPPSCDPCRTLRYDDGASWKAGPVVPYSSLTFGQRGKSLLRVLLSALTDLSLSPESIHHTIQTRHAAPGLIDGSSASLRRGQFQCSHQSPDFHPRPPQPGRCLIDFTLSPCTDPPASVSQWNISSTLASSSSVTQT